MSLLSLFFFLQLHFHWLYYFGCLAITESVHHGLAIKFAANTDTKRCFGFSVGPFSVHFFPSACQKTGIWSQRDQSTTLGFCLVAQSQLAAIHTSPPFSSHAPIFYFFASPGTGRWCHRPPSFKADSGSGIPPTKVTAGTEALFVRGNVNRKHVLMHKLDRYSLKFCSWLDCKP